MCVCLQLVDWMGDCDSYCYRVKVTPTSRQSMRKVAVVERLKIDGIVRVSMNHLCLQNSISVCVFCFMRIPIEAYK